MKWEEYRGCHVKALLTGRSSNSGDQWIEGYVDVHSQTLPNGTIRESVFLLHNNPGWSGGNRSYNVPRYRYQYNWMISTNDDTTIWCREIRLLDGKVVDRTKIQVGDSKLRFKFSL